MSLDELVLYVQSLIEIGAHAGPSEDELHTFIIRPPGVELPAPIKHPVQLYPHFVRYQRGVSEAA